MEEQELTADDIRRYWTQWLERASDEQVMAWHEVIWKGSDPDDLELDIAYQAALDKLDNVMRRGFARQSYKPQHRLGFYTTVNEWLTSRGFEAESEEEIDKMDLPPDVRRRAEGAEITPSA